MFRARTASVVCVIPLGVILIAAGRQNPPVFRAGVDLIQVDVSVLDKNRQPIRDLKASDFTVLEDGKPQPVEAFSEIVVPDPVEPTAKWMKDVSSEVVTNDLHDQRIIALVLDDAVIPGTPWLVNATKTIARQVIDHVGPNDLVTVIYTLANRQKTQDFTSDKAKLMAAVDKFTPGFATYGVVADDYLYYQYSENILQELANYLIAIPQRRKTLIYVSSGVPIDPSANAPHLVGGGGSIGGREEMVRLYEDLGDIFKRAQRANVNVYPVDPSGPGGVEDAVNLECLKLKGIPCLEQAHATANLSHDYLLEQADNTGGRATINTNDFTDGIAQIFRENGSYYLLGYRETDPKGPNSYSRLDVRVNRKDVEVRSRRINYTPKIDKALAAATPETRSMAGLLPDASTPMRVTAAPFARPSSQPRAKGDDATATVAVVMGVQEPAPKARVTEHVDLLTRAFSSEGDDRGEQQRQKADVTIRPAAAGDADQMARYEVLSQIALKPGRYQLRLAAGNTSRETSGSVFVDVDVPDFAKEPLSLSGVLLESSAGPASAPRDALEFLTPVIPTTERAFERTTAVHAFLRIYEGGKTPLEAATLLTRVLDDHDGIKFSSTSTIAPTRFVKDRGADITFDLPLAGLSPGVHLLALDAAM